MSALAKLGLSSGRESQSGKKTREKPAESQEDVLHSIDTMLERGDHNHPSATMATTGYLHKKSGAPGEARSASSKLSMVKSVRGGHWDKRFFVLPPDGITLSYYKTEEALMAGEGAQGR